MLKRPKAVVLLSMQSKLPLSRVCGFAEHAGRPMDAKSFSPGYRLLNDTEGAIICSGRERPPCYFRL